jgi:hypothetical protein
MSNLEFALRIILDLDRITGIHRISSPQRHPPSPKLWRGRRRSKRAKHGIKECWPAAGIME